MKRTFLESSKALAALPKITRRFLFGWSLLSVALLPILVWKLADEGVRSSAAATQLSTLHGTDAYATTLEIVGNLTSISWPFYGLLVACALVALGGAFAFLLLNDRP